MLKRETPGFVAVDLNQLIRVVEGIVRSDAVAHRVTLRLDLSRESCPVKGDAVQLQQVVLNLMLNAFSATGQRPGDGSRRVVVRTRRVDGSTVRADVQDNGTGIPPDKLDAVFEPFITSKPDGLGMGLAICRTIIERHGGKIWAANNPAGAGGATFSVTLPVAAGVAPHAGADGNGNGVGEAGGSSEVRSHVPVA
jgi:two-component system sensor kinase FixL